MSVNPLLQHTHYLKLSYQRNMLTAQATVAVIGGAIVSLAMLLASSTETESTIGDGGIERIRWSTQINLDPPPIVTVEHPHKGAPAPAMPLFANVTALPSEVIDESLLPNVAEPGPWADSLDIGSETGWPEFDDQGVGKTGGGRLGAMRMPAIPDASIIRPVLVVREALIRVPRPKYGRYQQEIAAEVTALIDYTSSGRIRKVTITSEYPVGLGFARRFREAINECQLWPRKYSDGHCDSGQIQLTYRWQPGGRDSTWSRGLLVEVR